MKPTPLTLRKKIAFELWRQKQAILIEEHPLRQLFWECTLRCDLKCRHCGSDCKMQPASKDMPKEDFLHVLDYIKRTREEGEIRVDYGCEGFLGNYEGEVRNLLYSCQAGITVGGVMADGAIGACTSIRADYHQGNIYEDDFMEVWEKRFAPYRQREWKKTGECADCKYFRYCQGNGMHLRDTNKQLLLCHLKVISSI